MQIHNNTISVSSNETDNILSVAEGDFLLRDFAAPYRSGGGGGCLFILEDSNGQSEDRVIKICKLPVDSRGRYRKRVERFAREIGALKTAKENNCNYIVKHSFDGVIPFRSGGRSSDHLFYVMEKAEMNLTEFLLENELDNAEKIRIFRHVLDGVQELHALGIYHRDIKPDNILLCADESWKLCDLGLVAFRGEDNAIDIQQEKIGPYGWLSPEAANKFLTEGTRYQFDCFIDGKSDVFQLGKLLWYILQGNLPIGQFVDADLRTDVAEIFRLLCSMLRHDKSTRYELQQVIDDIGNFPVALIA